MRFERWDEVKSIFSYSLNLTGFNIFNYFISSFHFNPSFYGEPCELNTFLFPDLCLKSDTLLREHCI